MSSCPRRKKPWRKGSRARGVAKLSRLRRDSFGTFLAAKKSTRKSRGGKFGFNDKDCFAALAMTL